MEGDEYAAGGVMGREDETEVLLHHLQESRGRLPPHHHYLQESSTRSVSVMVGLFGHGQFYSLIWAPEMIACASVLVKEQKCNFHL